MVHTIIRHLDPHKKYEPLYWHVMCSKSCFKIVENVTQIRNGVLTIVSIIVIQKNI